MVQVLFGQAASGEGGGLMTSPMFPMYLAAMVMLLMVVVVWPASRRARREEEKMRSSIKKGSRVVTTAGIVGTVVGIKDGDDEIVIRSEDTKLRVKRHAVAQVVGHEAESAK